MARAKATLKAAARKLTRMPRLAANFSEMRWLRCGESRAITMVLCQEKTRPWATANTTTIAQALESLASILG